MKRKELIKKAAAVLAAVGILGGALAGCAGKQETGTGAGTTAAETEAGTEAGTTAAETGEEVELTTIKVGATPAPHAEILEIVKDNLQEKGYNLEIVEYNDYILPNNAVQDGELDANFFQHTPYLEDFNAQNGTTLVDVATIHFEPFGLYAGKTASLEELQEGAKVAVPNDTTNEARALLLLEAQGLIKLKEGVGISATKIDIVENPLNLEIVELEAAQIARTLPDVDIAAINGNYAVDAGLKLSDALAVEAADSLAAQTYGNVLVVKEGNEDSEVTKALVEVLLSEEVKEYINATYEGAVVPVF
ncbi:MAG: MetQ/NlpA family ABC transporter substrate-binding protein [Lachnospiraceae bacterium]|nr:MetQ/NlpA family ABC transporter substrate-binding protein [Lachnospiraceae bacterium]MDD7026838.1 MetQ/NlpA family ABC transporter substrate-binding protein [Lachnospiraceae bacterium]MDY5700544.1 MetQ/NlpA family ABC transporter substrate-binding protein [Lachnospiraceae bacterium]